MTSGKQREVCEGLERDVGLDGSDFDGVVAVAGWHGEWGRERHDLN